MVFAAILLSIGEGSGRGSSGGNSDLVLMYGIVPILFASVLSGLASSLCQWASQVRSLFIVILNKALKSVQELDLMATNMSHGVTHLKHADVPDCLLGLFFHEPNQFGFG